MSGPTSELLILSIPTTKRIEDASTADGQLWASMISAYKSAPETRNVYWGRKIEDPGTVVFIVEWTALKCASETEQLMIARAAQEAIPKLTTANAVLPYIPYYKVPFAGPLDVPLSAPCTEFSIAFFPKNATNNERATFASTTATFMEAVSIHPQSSKGFASGWTVDDVLHPARDGQKGRAFVSALGWDSREAHYAFNKTEIVAQNIGGMAAGRAKAWEIIHINAIKA